VTLTGSNALGTQAAGCTAAGTNYYASAQPLSASTGSRSFATNETGTIFFQAGTALIANPIPANATPIQ
jgi:hypothetical protein